MIRGAIIAALLCGSALESAAHEIPARRQVVAQADDAGAMFLVTWTSARGPQGSQLVARAMWGRNDTHRQDALEALAAHEALAGLEILADGAAVEPTSIEVKIRLDARQPARLVAVVLVTVRRGDARRITVRNRSAVSTRLMWTSPDRAATGPDRSRRWLPGRRALTLTWTRPKGAASPGASNQQRTASHAPPSPHAALRSHR